MLRNFLAKRRMRKFLTVMPRALAHDYGGTSEYTTGQVKTALKKLGYTEEFEDIAISIYCNNEVAKAFGIHEALVKKYKGYPQQHRVNFDVASGGGFDGGGPD
jgi:hypothetical protein